MRHNELSNNRLDEAMWVVKSLDGVEKRFKDRNSDEAKEWAASVKKKPAKIKHEKFTNEWWQEKEDADFQMEGTYPWSELDKFKISDDSAIEAYLNTEFSGIEHDAEFGRSGFITVAGVRCAYIKLVVRYKITPEDDMGVEEDTEDSVTIKFVRNHKNPVELLARY